MHILQRNILLLCAMCLVVVSSNYLVQFPLDVQIANINLSDLLTWGAFTYPIAFLITDITNRFAGPAIARKIVLAGFALAVVFSFYFSTPRIAIASGTAFLLAQLLDVSIFDRLRNSAWWQAPAVSSLLGSTLDTALFFTLAFASSFVFLGPNLDFAIENGPVLGVFSQEAPRWISWAVGDYIVKLAVAGAMLLPYGLVVKFYMNKYSPA